MEHTNTRRITLIRLVDLDTESQLKIRDIRNEEGIRKWMYTDHLIGVNEHLAWINQLKADDRQIVFAVLEGHAPLGLVSVSAIDRLHKKADWAYYLTSTARGGLGSTLEYTFINFIFDTLQLEKLNCEVLTGNDPVVRLHKKFLFQEEGMRRSNIIKDGTRIGVHFLGLTKEDWLAGKDAIRSNHSDVLSRFEITIQWTGDDRAPKGPIDQIEAARARNNLNWMSILRMAIEKCPDTAKPIVAEIRTIDRQISDLTQEILTPLNTPKNSE